MVTTIHGFSSEQIVPVFAEVQRGAGTTSRSATQTGTRASTTWRRFTTASTCGEFERGEGPGDYLLFFGRIHPEKGTPRRSTWPRGLGLPLIIAGIIQDQEYFEQFVEPRSTAERIRYIGPVGPDRRGDLLGGARALLHLVNFDEPFGFSVVEAMACGTPVIARPRGSMSEIVRDGENGFLVDSLDEAVAAVHASAVLDRRRCERRSSTASTRTGWSDDYLAVYHGSLRSIGATRRRRQCPLTPGPNRANVFGSASTTGRLAMRWAGGRTSTTRRSQPTSRGSPRAVSFGQAVPDLGGFPAGSRRGG